MDTEFWHVNMRTFSYVPESKEKRGRWASCQHWKFAKWDWWTQESNMSGGVIKDELHILYACTQYVTETVVKCKENVCSCIWITATTSVASDTNHSAHCRTDSTSVNGVCLLTAKCYTVHHLFMSHLWLSVLSWEITQADTWHKRQTAAHTHYEYIPNTLTQIPGLQLRTIFIID